MLNLVQDCKQRKQLHMRQVYQENDQDCWLDLSRGLHAQEPGTAAT